MVIYYVRCCFRPQRSMVSELGDIFSIPPSKSYGVKLLLRPTATSHKTKCHTFLVSLSLSVNFSLPHEEMVRTDVDLRVCLQPPITVLLPFCRLFFPKKNYGNSFKRFCIFSFSCYKFIFKVIFKMTASLIHIHELKK